MSTNDEAGAADLSARSGADGQAPAEQGPVAGPPRSQASGPSQSSVQPDAGRTEPASYAPASGGASAPSTSQEPPSFAPPSRSSAPAAAGQQAPAFPPAGGSPLAGGGEDAPHQAQQPRGFVAPGAEARTATFSTQTSGPAAAVAAEAPAQRPETPQYTAVPQPPAGYSFSRGPESRPPAHQPAPPGTAGGYALPDVPTHATGAPVQSPGAPGAPGAPVHALGAPGGPTQPPAAPAAPRGRRGPGWAGVIGISLVVALLSGAGAVATSSYLEQDAAAEVTASAAPTAIATGPTTQTVTSSGTSPDWEAVTAAVSNAVVAITVAVDGRTAVGSGVIYDDSGHIVTNHHVVASASQIQVTLADGRIYDANRTGTDPATDLAVIEIVDAPDDLTVARLGDSDTLVTGQDVLAIGNPLGLSSTATTGIISALDRPVVTTQEDTGEGSQQGGSGVPDALGNLLGQNRTTTTETYTNAIQVDAAINPGNSGGPLFDETGAVIGITSSIATMSSSDQSGGSIGIGFSIPSNLTSKVADQLIATGTATHAYLGVATATGGASANGVTRAGAEVGSVEAGSPAEAAGVKEGDVIVAIDGKPTSQAAALTGFVRQYSAGDTVTLTIIRAGAETEVKVTLVERTDS